MAAMDPRENVEASRASLTGNNRPLRTMLERLADRPPPRPTPGTPPTAD